MTEEMNPWDMFLWLTFLDDYPSWKLISYDDRVIIESKHGWIHINAVSMEAALIVARRELSRKYYYIGTII